MKNDALKIGPGPPAISEYSKNAAEKAVTKATLVQPITVYPAVIGVLGLLSFGMFGSSVPVVGLMLSGFFVAIGSWIVNYFFRSESFSQKYFKQLDGRRNEYKSWLIEKVKIGLSQNYETETALTHAKQGREQFDRSKIVRDSIQELLVMKLSVNELTFHRFLAATEQAYLSLLDNLKNVVARLKSANSIIPSDLQQRLHDMKGKSLSVADQEEEKALQERLKLWNEQMEKVDTMLSQNEKVITEMENISARIAEWNTDQQFGASDLESVINELQTLARCAYNINHEK